MFIISIASNKILTKGNFINSVIFSGILFAYTINAHKSIARTQENIDILKVFSYRSASCGCCKKWINHLRDNRLEVVDNIVEDVSIIKKQYQISNNFRSYHSSQIANFKINGHVPFESINKLFREKLIINRLAFPVMHFGSPGMGMHYQDSHSHYYGNFKVVSVSKTDDTKIYQKFLPNTNNKF